MSRTHRPKRNEHYFRYDPEDHVWCDRCKGHHFARYRGNTPICSDGVYSETGQNRCLKDHRRATQRRVGKQLVTSFKAGQDIEGIPYLCNKDIRMDYHLL